MDIKTIKTWVHSATRDLNHNGNSSSVYLFNSNNIFFTIVVPNFGSKSDFVKV